MKLNAVVIRTKEQLLSMNEYLVKGLKSLKKTDEIPLIYNYLHNPKNELVVDSNNRIGMVTNIRKNSRGDIIGDVIISNILKLASNFVGVIDNIAASIEPSTNNIKINAFIIYDVEAKNKVTEIKKKSNSIAKLGEIPLMSNVDQDMMKEISDTLLNEYKNLVEKQECKSILKEETDKNG